MEPDTSNEPEDSRVKPPDTRPGWQGGFFVPLPGTRRRPSLITQLGALVLLIVPTVLLLILVLPLALLLLAVAVCAVAYLIARAWIISWWRGRSNPELQRRNVRVRREDSGADGQSGSASE